MILIEDGSPDNALGVCKELEGQYEKIKLLRHHDGENIGISASRNLGIENASCNFIAFLDADDWYLPHRFKKDHEVFQDYPQADAVYSCTILEQDQQDMTKRYGVTSDPRVLWGQELTPMEFYRQKLINRRVLFHTNSITLKRKFLLKDKCFDTRLRMHEDSELWNRLLRSGNFYAAEWNIPVAVIRRHDKNTITGRSYRTNLKMLAVMIDNIGWENLEEFEKMYCFEGVLRSKSKRFSNHWLRRGYYYGNRFIKSLYRDHFLRNFTKHYG